MLFDRPAVLPVATVRGSRVATATSWWRGLRTTAWRWSRPRLVPLAVALTGMFAVLGSAEYLTRLARRTPVQSTPTMQLATIKPEPVTIIDGDPVEMGTLTIDNGPVGAMVFLDGNPFPMGRVLQLPAAGAPMQIRLLPTR